VLDSFTGISQIGDSGGIPVRARPQIRCPNDSAVQAKSSAATAAVAASAIDMSATAKEPLQNGKVLFEERTDELMKETVSEQEVH
jgi:hypothetical protein